MPPHMCFFLADRFRHDLSNPPNFRFMTYQLQCVHGRCVFVVETFVIPGLPQIPYYPREHRGIHVMLVCVYSQLQQYIKVYVFRRTREEPRRRWNHRQSPTLHCRCTFEKNMVDGFTLCSTPLTNRVGTAVSLL